jgi:hypothetical protein
MVNIKIYALIIDIPKESEEDKILDNLGIPRESKKEAEYSDYLTEAWIDETKIMCLYRTSDNSKDWIMSMDGLAQIDIKIPDESAKILQGVFTNDK